MVNIDASRDYYADLEVPSSADLTQLKKQYRKLVLVWHPDRNPGRESEVNPKFQKIQTAYEILTDPEQRAKYDDLRARAAPRAFRYTSAASAYGQTRPMNPYANAGAGYPPPPKAPTAARNPPASAGARRYSKFESRTGGSSRQTDEGAEARTNAYYAWERMKHANTAQSSSPKSGPQMRTEPDSGPFSRRPPPVPKNRPTFTEDRPRTSEARTSAGAPPFSSRKTGFMPSNPSGDEPAAASRARYATRGPRESVPRFYGPEPTSEDDAPADPLGDFEEKLSFEPRLRTPYASHGGERTDPFASVNVNRSKSTRESSARDRNSGAGFTATGGSTERHRSASPHIKRESASYFKSSSGAGRGPADDNSQFKRTQSQKDFTSTAAAAGAGKFQSQQKPSSSHHTGYRDDAISISSSTSSDEDSVQETPSTRKTKPMRQPRQQNASSTAQQNGTATPGSQAKPGSTMYDTPHNHPLFRHPSASIRYSQGPGERIVFSRILRSNSVSSHNQGTQPSSEAGTRRTSLNSERFPRRYLHRSSTQGSMNPNEQLEARQFRMLDDLLKNGTSRQRSKEPVITQWHNRWYGYRDKPLTPEPPISNQSTPDMYDIIDKLCRSKKFEPIGSSISSQRTEFKSNGAKLVGDPTKQQSFPAQCFSNMRPTVLKDTSSNINADSKPCDSFTFNLDENQNGNTTLPRFKPKSVENIHTTFSSQDWHGKFEAGDIFAMDKNAPPRTKSPSKPRGRSPTKSRPTGLDPNDPIPVDINPEMSPQQKEQQRAASSPGEKFKPDEWTDSLKSDMFAFPSPTRGQKPAFAAARSSRSTRSNNRKPQDKSASMESLDSGSDEGVKVASGEATPGGSKTRANLGVPSPNAMDIDPPLAEDATKEKNGARNVTVEPSRPEWRPGNIDNLSDAMKNGAGPRAVPEGKRRAAERPGGAENLKTNLEDLKNVEPLFDVPKGLNSFSDLGANLPFKSQPSRAPPVSKTESKKQTESEDLDLPHPPKAPAPPVAAKSSLPPSQSSWATYLATFKAYMSEWDIFNSKMIGHFASRKTQVNSLPVGWLEAKGNEWMDEYRKGLRQDVKVREWWSVASERHARAIEEFCAVKEMVRERAERG